MACLRRPGIAAPRVAGCRAFIRAGPAVMAKGIKCEACRVIRMSQRQESLDRQKNP
ncbi:hypothetical protein GWQ29_11230 [Aeromonas sp. 2HA2]|nr:hypothetical protein [Aeromonas sp. 2HA2]